MRTEKMIKMNYGKLLATELAGKDRHGHALMRCLCECGTITVVRVSNLRSGRTTSCGCWNREVSAERLATHGMSSTAEYQAWRSMKARCNDPASASYSRYGGRGIKVCDRWLNSLEAFLMDVGPKPGKSYHLHRKNRNDDYGPDTTEWATDKQCRADRAAEKKQQN